MTPWDLISWSFGILLATLFLFSAAAVVCGGVYAAYRYIRYGE